MQHVNLWTFLVIKLLKKSYDASNKFNFPNVIKNLFYKLYFLSLQKILDPYLDRSLSKINDLHYIGKDNSKIIWILWWQGYKGMPLIVKRCISSIKMHANGYKVILITKDNIKKYTDIPDYIYNKVIKGYITLTHFSDILRFNLLDNNGGLWCDATLFCTSNLDKQYFDYLYTSGGYVGTPPKFVAGRWTGFLIGGNRHNALFQFMNKFFNLYWKNNKYQVAYFLIDLALHYAYVHNIGDFKDYTDKVACHHNPNMFKLADLLNKPYNLKLFKYIIQDTNMFKLTYKKKFVRGNTFYQKLVHNKL